MPLITYKCKCGNEEKVLLSGKALKNAVGKKPCPICEDGLGLVRQLGAPGSTSKMIVDTGSMAKAIEVLRDVQEIQENVKNREKLIPKDKAES